MRLDIVTPERQLVSTEITQVQIPGMEGDLTVMPNHAPFLTTLRPGIVTVHGQDGVKSYVVTGGFAEVSPEATTILAEQGVPREDASREMIEGVLQEANAALEASSPEARAAAQQRVNDVNDLLIRHGI